MGTIGWESEMRFASINMRYAINIETGDIHMAATDYDDIVLVCRLFDNLKLIKVGALLKLGGKHRFWMHAVDPPYSLYDLKEGTPPGYLWHLWDRPIK